MFKIISSEQAGLVSAKSKHKVRLVEEYHTGEESGDCPDSNYNWLGSGGICKPGGPGCSSTPQKTTKMINNYKMTKIGKLYFPETGKTLDRQTAAKPPQS